MDTSTHKVLPKSLADPSLLVFAISSFFDKLHFLIVSETPPSLGCVICSWATQRWLPISSLIDFVYNKTVIDWKSLALTHWTFYGVSKVRPNIQLTERLIYSEYMALTPPPPHQEKLNGKIEALM